MRGSNPFIGTTGKERYKLYRQSIIQALVNGPLNKSELSKALGLSITAIHSALMEKSKSRLKAAILDLQADGVVRNYYQGREQMWELAGVQAEDKDSVKLPTNSKELFDLFQQSLEKEAKEKAEQFYKNLIDGLREQLTRQQEKIAQLEQRLNFRKAAEHEAKDNIWGMCQRCAKLKYNKLDWQKLNGLKISDDVCPVCNHFDAIIPLSDLEFAAGLTTS